MTGQDYLRNAAADQAKKDARLRSMVFSLVVQSGTVNNPDKALEKAKEIYIWIKEGK